MKDGRTFQMGDDQMPAVHNLDEVVGRSTGREVDEVVWDSTGRDSIEVVWGSTGRDMGGVVGGSKGRGNRATGPDPFGGG